MRLTAAESCTGLTVCALTSGARAAAARIAFSRLRCVRTGQ